jgi:hypothetical protein
VEAAPVRRNLAGSNRPGSARSSGAAWGYWLDRDGEPESERGQAMYTVVRHYTGAGPLAQAMVERHQDVEAVLRGVPGFRAYYALLANDGAVVTVTVCDDRVGTTESTRRAAAWIRQHLAGVSVSPVQITEGDVFLDF